MPEIITNNLRIKGSRINLQFKVLTFICMIVLGYMFLGGGKTALGFGSGNMVSVNPGYDIEWTFNQTNFSRKLRYWTETKDATAVAGTDYDKINGWVEVTSGTHFKIKTKTYNNANATSSLTFSVELRTPQYFFFGEWYDISAEDNVPLSYEGKGEIVY